jgi:5-formyltetrahydrofolate cyclo-ligase
VTLQKKDWRLFFRQQLAALDIQHKKSFTAQMMLHLSSALAEVKKERLRQEPLQIGAYAPLDFEVDCVSAFQDVSCLLSFPTYVESLQTMIYRQCAYQDLSVKQTFGVSLLEPKTSAPEVIPDILLIPGIGFDHRGIRLGRGKGYFDRYLACYKGLKWGIGFSVQLVEQLPCEEHDIPMDMIITENGLLIVKH